MTLKEIKELLKSTEIKSLTAAINRLADVYERQIEIADRANKLTEKEHQVNRRLLLENRKASNSSHQNNDDYNKYPI